MVESLLKINSSNCHLTELFVANIDVEAMESLEHLLKKVDEMKKQRASLWNELRDAVHNDDITSVLVTRQPEQSLDELFQKEIEKHKKLVQLNQSSNVLI